MTFPAPAEVLVSHSRIASDRQKPGRMASLDSLRGVAILMVICAHYLPQRLAFGAAGNAISTLGRGGVILFFLLSGYLIFKNLQHQKMFPFIGRRLFKIFPAFWVNVLIIASLGVLIEGYPRYSLPVYLTNFFLVSDVFKTASISGVYWTLLIEVKFYIFIAIYYFFLRDRYIPGAMLVVVFINVLLWAERGKASQLFTFAPIFFIGIQAYLAEKSGWSQRSLITLALMAIMAGLNVWIFDAYYNTWSLAYLLAGTVSLLFLLRSNNSNVTLGFFGRISYSHYLYHTSVGYLLFGLFASTRTLAGNIVAVSIVFLATSMLAYISYRYIELPFVRAGKSLEARWNRV